MAKFRPCANGCRPLGGGGGSAKEKKGLLVEIVETFSLSLAHERYDVRYLFYGIFLFLFTCREEEDGQPQRSKKELIALAKEIAAASKEVSNYSARIAKDCPDKRVAQVCGIYEYR